MGAHKRPCPQCKAPSEAGMFCGQCGAKVPEHKRTVMGMPQVELGPSGVVAPKAAAHPQASDRADHFPAPIEVAVPAPAAPVTAAPAAGATAAAPGPAAGPPVKAKGGARNRTMMGMGVSPFGTAAGGGPVQASPGVLAPPALSPSPSPSPSSPVVTPATAPAGVGPPAPVEPPAGAAPAPAPPSSPTAARSNRTMLGMPVVTEGPASEPPPVAPNLRGGMAAKSNRTMLGLTPPGAPQVAAGEPAPTARQRAPVEYGAAPEVPPRPSSKGLTLVLAGLVLMGVAVASLAAAAFFWMESGPGLEATIVRGGRGEALRVRAPEAPAGSKVRFAGVEYALEDGTATFPIASRVLHIGENELELALVAPDGDVQRSRITLTVNFRIRADLTGLADTPPAIDVVVDVLPQTTVTLDGQALTVDAAGHGSRRFPLSVPETGAVFEHAIPFTLVFAEGRTESGSLSTRVPFATLQIEQPGERLVTEARSVQIVGVVGSGASVTVNGAEARVADGRFSVPFVMAQPGSFEVQIRVRQPGTLPRTRRVQIRRVTSLRREAARFRPHPDATYGAIREDPAAHRGQRVALEGRVYHVNPGAGRTVLQVVVRPCPTGNDCILWVTYPSVIEAAVGAEIRILGVAAGVQQFRNQNNRVLTAPRVDAEIILAARHR